MSPIADPGLHDGEGRSHRGVGAQHARAETDRGNKLKLAQRVKLGFRETAFGADQQRPWPRLGSRLGSR
jgi:hypothetical protein